MNICVQGLWHLGCVTAAGLASLGHEVVGLDSDEQVVAGLSRGRPPLFEPGLAELIERGLASGRLRFTNNARAALGRAEVLWAAHDTPVDHNDAADVDSVINQIKASFSDLNPGAAVLVSSQLPVGSIKKLEKFAKARHPGKKFHFACSPENLRLGRALEVFLRPDRLVMGVRDQAGRDFLSPLTASITERVEWMTVESAEMTKHALNAFLALSIAFANEIASLCELTGADAREVERGLKSEGRIGPGAYLSPGGPFAGGTLARDLNFLSRSGDELGLELPLIKAVKPSNDAHRQWAGRQIAALLKDQPAEAGVAVWGLTYKPDTDTLRRSAAVELVDSLLEDGRRVGVHDPAVRELPAAWRGRVVFHHDPLKALPGARVLVVATEWPDYRKISVEEFAKAAEPGLTIIDANRFLHPLKDQPGFNYLAVGLPGVNR